MKIKNQKIKNLLVYCFKAILPLYEIFYINFTEISTILYIETGVLNTFYIQSIGSGFVIYSGLFHSQIIQLLSFYLSLLILYLEKSLYFSLELQSIYILTTLYSGLFPIGIRSYSNSQQKVKKSNLKNRLIGIITEMKIGWNMTKEPEWLIDLNSKIYFKIFRVLGSLCVVLVTSGSAKEVLANRPLGEFGQMTLNQFVTNLQNSILNSIFNSVNVNIHVFSGLSDGFSYTLMLRSFLRHIYHRPMSPYLSANGILREQALRNSELRIFMFATAPINLGIVKLTGLGLKDVVTVSYPQGPSPGNPPGDGSNFVNQGILFFANLNKFRNKLPNLKKFRNKLPNWFKIIIILIIISLILYKLWGFNVILLLFTQKF